MYEMAELCYRFTMVVSPDTELLCERMKAFRCELKLKQLLQERQLWVFYLDLRMFDLTLYERTCAKIFDALKGFITRSQFADCR